MDEALSNYTKKEQCELLTINEDPEVGETFMFGKYVYLYIFYCLYYEMGIFTDMSEDQVLEDRDPDLNDEEDVRLDSIRKENWSDVAEEGDNKNNIHSLIWDVYIKEK